MPQVIYCPECNHAAIVQDGRLTCGNCGHISNPFLKAAMDASRERMARRVVYETEPLDYERLLKRLSQSANPSVRETARKLLEAEAAKRLEGSEL